MALAQELPPGHAHALDLHLNLGMTREEDSLQGHHWRASWQRGL